MAERLSTRADGCGNRGMAVASYEWQVIAHDAKQLSTPPSRADTVGLQEAAPAIPVHGADTNGSWPSHGLEAT